MEVQEQDDFGGPEEDAETLVKRNAEALEQMCQQLRNNRSTTFSKKDGDRQCAETASAVGAYVGAYVSVSMVHACAQLNRTMIAPDIKGLHLLASKLPDNLVIMQAPATSTTEAVRALHRKKKRTSQKASASSIVAIVFSTVPVGFLPHDHRHEIRVNFTLGRKGVQIWPGVDIVEDDLHQIFHETLLPLMHRATYTFSRTCGLLLASKPATIDNVCSKFELGYMVSYRALANIPVFKGRVDGPLDGFDFPGSKPLSIDVAGLVASPPLCVDEKKEEKKKMKKTKIRVHDNGNGVIVGASSGAHSLALFELLRSVTVSATPLMNQKKPDDDKQQMLSMEKKPVEKGKRKAVSSSVDDDNKKEKAKKSSWLAAALDRQERERARVEQENNKSKKVRVHAPMSKNNVVKPARGKSLLRAAWSLFDGV